MQDITEYTDHELAMIVLNDEAYLYIATISEDVLYDVIKNNFIYTDIQLKHLKESVTDYKIELIEEEEAKKLQGNK